MGEQQAVRDLEAVLVALDALALGGELGRRRHEARHALGGALEQRLHAQRPAVGQLPIQRLGVLDHPRYAGRRIFGAGINLTHLYHGRIAFAWYVVRDMGYVNKIYRGLSAPEHRPGEPEETVEVRGRHLITGLPTASTP